ncbi:hypothetical protein HKX48_001147 [Thoreauomyces humboldtii]|nr:hypothetical protein HKX48_001147 [Thoreauomyces humboldtii]
MVNLFLVLYVVAYVLLWAHVAYALCMGPIHQLTSLRRHGAKLAKEALRARASPGGPVPLAPPDLAPHRMTMRSAVIAWSLCAVAVLAMAILPYMIMFSDTGEILIDHQKSGTYWWDRLEVWHERYVASDVENVELVGSIFLFIVINREIIIMSALAICFRWPKMDPRLSGATVFLRDHLPLRRLSTFRHVNPPVKKEEEEEAPPVPLPLLAKEKQKLQVMRVSSAPNLKALDRILTDHLGDLPDPKSIPEAPSMAVESDEIETVPEAAPASPTNEISTQTLWTSAPPTDVNNTPSSDGMTSEVGGRRRGRPAMVRSVSLGELTTWASGVPEYSAPFKNVRHAVVIACHNSSEVLVGTLTRLLALVEPKAVFLADNGSSKDEVAATKKVAADLTTRYKETHPDYKGSGINVGVLEQGSKTIAQFSVLNSLAYLKSDIEFVSLLDDDTVFPDDWSEKYVMNMFDDQLDTHCLAYPIGAERTPNMNLLEHFQDFEYRISMFTKHDTMFRGDDLQMGLLMHTLYNEINFLNPNEVHKGNYAIRVAPFIIPTMVPVHWFHWKDLFPKIYWKKLPGCECGEPSLFYQRARSWEVARHRFFGKFMRVVVHSQGLDHWNTTFAKICSLDAVIGIINDFLQIAMVVLVVVLARSGIMIGILSLVSISFQLLAFDILNLLVIDRSEATAIPCEIRVLYPLCYSAITNIVVKQAALVYNYFHYTPMVRNLAVIGRQARKEILDSMWTSWSPEEVVSEGGEVLRDVAQRIRDMEKRKRRLGSWSSKDLRGPYSASPLSPGPKGPVGPSSDALVSSPVKGSEGSDSSAVSSDGGSTRTSQEINKGFTLLGKAGASLASLD